MRPVHISYLASIALCGLLEHQCMLSPFVIVTHESLNCPQCEKMHFKIIQSMLERIQICWKTKECAGAEEQQTVELLRTNKGLIMNNYH